MTVKVQTKVDIVWEDNGECSRECPFYGYEYVQYEGNIKTCQHPKYKIKCQMKESNKLCHKDNS